VSGKTNKKHISRNPLLGGDGGNFESSLCIRLSLLLEKRRREEVVRER
jgi:hypothetical protein